MMVTALGNENVCYMFTALMDMLNEGIIWVE